MPKEDILNWILSNIKSDIPVFSVEKDNIRLDINWSKGAKSIWIYLVDKRWDEIKGLSYLLITDLTQYLRENKKTLEDIKACVNCFSDIRDIEKDLKNSIDSLIKTTIE